MEHRLKSDDTFSLKRLKTQYREYFSNYSLLITLGTIWIFTALTGLISIHLCKLLFIAGISLLKPIVSGISHLLKTNKINRGSSLKLSTRLLAIGIVFGLSVVFFPFSINNNLFYPSFNIITGLVFLVIARASHLNVYWLIAVLQLLSGGIIAHYYPDDFTLAGYIGGATMLGTGIMNGFIAKFMRNKFKIRKLKSKSLFNTFKLMPGTNKKTEIAEDI